MPLRIILAALAFWLAAPLPSAHANPVAGETVIGNVVLAQVPGHHGCLALQQNGAWLLTSGPRQFALDAAAERVRRHVVATFNPASVPPPGRPLRHPTRATPHPAPPHTMAPSVPWLMVYPEEPEACPAQLGASKGYQNHAFHLLGNHHSPKGRWNVTGATRRTSW